MAERTKDIKNREKALAKKGITEMPHNLEAEQALLGCILLDTKIQIDIGANLKENDFYSEAHKNIFHAILDIIKRNQPVDMVTLTDTLEKMGTLNDAGGISYIAELTNIIPSSANYQRYLSIVSRDSMLRKLMAGAVDIIGECQTSQDEVSALSFAEKTVYDISNTVDTREMVRIDKVLPDVMFKFDEISKGSSLFRGIPTQFKKLDNIIKGVHKSDLMILAARPAVGKTSFAMNIAGNIALQGYTCAVFSLEMSKEQLTQRMICSVAGVSMDTLYKGDLTNKNKWWRKVIKAKELLSNAKIFIDDTASITPTQIMSKCRRIKAKHGLDFVVIDYVQLMTPDKRLDNRQQEITEISRSLKILAKEIDVPVLALSQLSRAVETRKGRPQLSDLRESGAIEQDADIVMFIHRPDKNAPEKDVAEGKIQANVAEIIVEKHRAGSNGTVNLYFKGESTKFLNIDDDGEIEDDDKDAPRAKVNIAGYDSLPEDDKKEKPAYDEPVDEQVIEGANIKSVDDEIF